ncbi:ATP-binding cassette domain-containing protein [Sphingomonas sp. IC4-52]|uniref:ATP-binding cassette domain-containing protein n=1 Tax=Sphingomonas sp. IC4-52 TaxID=2887202 RepID=UPI001D1161EC|nr:ATP-binding cassette domain-containing protein [Sphingomonas sp. IC4-52]MCC2979726.1 ATP-binding cassette domain-containing protein [Sphingomonas sp. IC4-52]
MSRLDRPGLESGSSEIPGVRVAFRSAVFALAILGPALWVIPVAACLYLMLLLDVALPGRSGETVAGLFAMSAALVAFYALLLSKRQQVLTAFADACDAAGEELHNLEQDSLRAVLLDGGVAALSDAASVPLLICTLALITGWLAVIPLFGVAIALVILTAEARAMKRQPTPYEDRRARDVSTAVITAWRERLGLLRLAGRAEALITAQRHGAAVSDAASASRAAKTRLALFVLSALCLAGVAGAATWLAATDDASIGAVGAALLLTAFIFHPLCRIGGDIRAFELAAGEWQALLRALDQRRAINMLVALPAPQRDLDVTGVGVPLAGTRQPLFRDLTFKAKAGDVLAVIGPADAGKSTLLKVLAGHVPESVGTVRLDGAALSQWGREALDRHIGYLPQVPELMRGTVAQNIAGFISAPDAAAITRAAEAAGAHDAIVRLPAGYDTMVSISGHPSLALSVQQRIACARALYGDPFLVLLDNPGTFQDNDGHLALRRCLSSLQARGAVTVVVGDAPSIIESANLVLVMRKGGMLDFGQKEEVRARLSERQRREAERLAEMSVYAEPRNAPADAPTVE